jgi:hypothetical protein
LTFHRAAKEEAIKLKNKRKSSIIGSIMSLGRTKEEEDDTDEQDLQEVNSSFELTKTVNFYD